MTIPVAIDISETRSHLDRALPQALDVLRQMVEINSFTRNAAGVNQVGELTAQLFEPLGFIVERPQAIDCTTSHRPLLGRHLILTRPGRPGPGGSDRKIGLVGHLDTVFTEEDEQGNDFHWKPIGDRIYGPGTVDMKAGNVLIWMVLSTIQKLAPVLFDEVTWLVMFNAAEEGLDSDFGTVQRQRLGADALANLVFEGGKYHNGEHHLIGQRKGSAGFRITAHGRSAHAGAAHERGANAIVQLSHFIAQVSQFTDYSQEVTCNVGVVHAGTVANRVPDHAAARMEMRAFDPDILERTYQRIMALNGMSTVHSHADGFPAHIQLLCDKRLPAWPRNERTERLISVWQRVGQSLGMSIVNSRRGGLSDGNFTQDLVPTIDGLGPAGDNLHCAARSPDGSADQEYVLPSTFVPRALLHILCLERLITDSRQSV